MFTGIIEATAKIIARDGARLTIERPAIFTDVIVGSSIAINGTCLTVVVLDDQSIGFDVVETTWHATTLGDLTIDAHINLERAMPANGRFDGHMVQGHVEGVAEVIGIIDHHTEKMLTLAVPPALLPAIVDRGSIAVDGVSLTVASQWHDRISIALVPHTCKATTLAELKPKMRVNIETDILARYVASLIKHGA